MADLIYLDNAATTFPKPDAMHDAVRDFYKNYGVNRGRIPRGRRSRDKEDFQTYAVIFYRHTKKSLNVGKDRCVDPQPGRKPHAPPRR